MSATCPRCERTLTPGAWGSYLCWSCPERVVWTPTAVENDAVSFGGDY